ACGSWSTINLLDSIDNVGDELAVGHVSGTGGGHGWRQEVDLVGVGDGLGGRQLCGDRLCGEGCAEGEGDIRCAAGWHRAAAFGKEAGGQACPEGVVVFDVCEPRVGG